MTVRSASSESPRRRRRRARRVQLGIWLLALVTAVPSVYLARGHCAHHHL